jgi:hypothetical protein
MNYIDVAPVVLKITMKTIPQRQGLSQAMEHPAPEIAFFSPCTFAVKILKQMEQNEVESKRPRSRRRKTKRTRTPRQKLAAQALIQTGVNLMMTR